MGNHVIGMILATVIIFVFCHYINLFKAYKYLVRVAKMVNHDMKYNAPYPGPVIYKELDDAIKYVDDCKKWI